jgi:hypothetical protein
MGYIVRSRSVPPWRHGIGPHDTRHFSVSCWYSDKSAGLNSPNSPNSWESRRAT